MSRIRSIKPEYWSSEQVMAVCRDARLMFVGIWNFADDEGRFKWKARTIKAQVFPGDDDVTVACVETWLSDLEREGLVTRYSVDGETYGSINGWGHQKISHPTPSKLPEPPNKGSGKRSFPEDSGELQNPPEHSENDQGTLRPDLNRSDLKGSEGSTRAQEPERSPQDAKPQPANLARLKFEPDPHTEALRLVRSEFGRRFHEAEQDMWTQPNDPGVHTLAQWLAAKPAEARVEALRKTLDTFFADPWCASQHFPVNHLARHVRKYFDPREAPSQARASPDAETPEGIRALMSAAAAAGDIPRCHELKKRLDHVESQQERRRANGR